MCVVPVCSMCAYVHVCVVPVCSMCAFVCMLCVCVHVCVFCVCAVHVVFRWLFLADILLFAYMYMYMYRSYAVVGTLHRDVN